MKNQAWQRHEREVQELLDLSPTITSGNKWHDPGDGVDRGHYSEKKFPLIIDCKSTIHRSYSVKLDDLEEWAYKADEMGKRFAMPIRFHPKPYVAPPSDYILLSLNDFAELLQAARNGK